ncbi:NUDIX domain-containing protein [Pseudonocardia sp. ICBG1293]|uniref:NUDIX domain-containing protein n=1 Tax=Pseudonocardia sp. ICBG1293 TaxID=2844382 RepID=UPI001CCB9149|nr:NUDIX domain-containing protein [Pseudonocardia sp. ICBG1293]
MPVLSLDHHVDGPPRLVAGVLRESGPSARAVARVGARFTAPAALLVAGDEIRVALPGGFLACRTRITRAGADGLWSELAAGPAAVLRHSTRVTPAAGGGVEDGEGEPHALARECAEELGARVTVGERLGTDLPIGRRVLRIHTARLDAGSPEPAAREHRALRWVGPREVAALGWLDADRAVVAELVALLRT